MSKCRHVEVIFILTWVKSITHEICLLIPCFLTWSWNPRKILKYLFISCCTKGHLVLEGPIQSDITTLISSVIYNCLPFFHSCIIHRSSTYNEEGSMTWSFILLPFHFGFWIFWGPRWRREYFQVIGGTISSHGSSWLSGFLTPYLLLLMYCYHDRLPSSLLMIQVQDPFDHRKCTQPWQIKVL
jgi:hypothetical protein